VSFPVQCFLLSIKDPSFSVTSFYRSESDPLLLSHVRTRKALNSPFLVHPSGPLFQSVDTLSLPFFPRTWFYRIRCFTFLLERGAWPFDALFLHSPPSEKVPDIFPLSGKCLCISLCLENTSPPVNRRNPFKNSLTSKRLRPPFRADHLFSPNMEHKRSPLR